MGICIYYSIASQIFVVIAAECNRCNCAIKVIGQTQLYPSENIVKAQIIVVADGDHNVSSLAETVGLVGLRRRNRGAYHISTDGTVRIVRIQCDDFVRFRVCPAADFRQRSAPVAGFAGELIAFVTVGLIEYRNQVAFVPDRSGVFVELHSRIVFAADRYMQDIIRQTIDCDILGRVRCAGGEHRRSGCKKK